MKEKVYWTFILNENPDMPDHRLLDGNQAYLTAKEQFFYDCLNKGYKYEIAELELIRYIYNEETKERKIDKRIKKDLVFDFEEWELYNGE